MIFAKFCGLKNESDMTVRIAQMIRRPIIIPPFLFILSTNPFTNGTEPIFTEVPGGIVLAENKFMLKMEDKNNEK